jgi:NADH-quinone oxidoreductase subunit G
LPGARAVTDALARTEMATAWDVDADAIPGRPGRDTVAILAAAREGALGGLLVAGVDPHDLPDPRAAEEALDAAGFLVSLEIRRTAVARRADVVLPVAPPVEKNGSYLNWEGRTRPFDVVLRTPALTDARVLDALAREMGVELGCGTLLATLQQIAGLGATQALRPATPAIEASAVREPDAGEAILATWHQLIDLGAMQDGDHYLAATARPPVARLPKATATELGVGDGDPVTVSTDRGAITLPALVVDAMADKVVWLPTNSPGSTVRRTLGVTEGATVRISAGGAR